MTFDCLKSWPILWWKSGWPRTRVTQMTTTEPAKAAAVARNSPGEKTENHASQDTDNGARHAHGNNQCPACKEYKGGQRMKRRQFLPKNIDMRAVQVIPNRRKTHRCK